MSSYSHGKADVLTCVTDTPLQPDKLKTHQKMAPFQQKAFFRSASHPVLPVFASCVPQPPPSAPSQCLCCKQSFLPPFILVMTFQIYYVLDKLSVHACGWNAALGLWWSSAHPSSPRPDMSRCISAGKKLHMTFILLPDSGHIRQGKASFQHI